MKSIPKHLLIGSMAVFMALSGNAIAASFSDADANGDKKLSMEELTKAGLQDLIDKFKSIDADKDGFLSKEELKANR